MKFMDTIAFAVLVLIPTFAVTTVMVLAIQHGEIVKLEQRLEILEGKLMQTKGDIQMNNGMYWSQWMELRELISTVQNITVSP